MLYRVTVEKVTTMVTTVEVDANDPEEAGELAIDEVEEKDTNGDEVGWDEEDTRYDVESITDKDRNPV